MGHYVANIVRMSRVLLNDDTHYPADKLDVGSEASERTKNRCDTQFWVIETLAKHLYLYDAIERTVSEIAKYCFFLIIGLLSVYDFGFETPLLVE